MKNLAVDLHGYMRQPILERLDRHLFERITKTVRTHTFLHLFYYFIHQLCTNVCYRISNNIVNPTLVLCFQRSK